MAAVIESCGVGLYVHVPFCKSRCIYCDFYSTTLPSAWQMPYVEALEQEMRLRRTKELVRTLYIGGGTPSLLTAEALAALFHAIEKNFTLAEGAEITLEANPDDISEQWIEVLQQTPVNRVSMGVQSLDDRVLTTLHRRHTAEQARRSVSLLKEVGYHNLSLDLIYGLPGQTHEQFCRDVEEVLALDIPHLSAYALQFEEGTPLFRLRQEGQVREADEELSLGCYETLIDLTAEAGLEHYEISNFARPGFRSRHNASYWTGVPYIGLGAGAHSYDGQRARSYNCEDVKQYIQSLSEGRLPAETEVLTTDERYNERIMLSLRTCEGLSLTALEQDFGQERRAYCERMAESHIQRGRLQRKTDETLCLARQGLFVSDDIISDLMV